MLVGPLMLVELVETPLMLVRPLMLVGPLMLVEPVETPTP